MRCTLIWRDTPRAGYSISRSLVHEATGKSVASIVAFDRRGLKFAVVAPLDEQGEAPIPFRTRTFAEMATAIRYAERCICDRGHDFLGLTPGELPMIR